MALTDEAVSPAPDDVEEVAWNLESLVDGKGAAGVDELLDRAETMLPALLEHRERVATMDAATLAGFMSSLSDLQELIGKAASYAGLKFAVDTSDPANGALMQRVQERATAIGTQLIWFELEWAAIPDESADAILADERVSPYRYHLESERRYRPHLLTEPEEKIDAEKSVTGRSAWVRLFSELSAEIKVTLPDGVEAPLERGLALMMHPDRETRQQAAEAITAGLAPGLRTRAFIFNTLLADKSTDDRLRAYPTWITSRNLANQATDESVEALVDAVKRRYDIPQRWYTMKRQILGLPRLADYDRYASVAASETLIDWPEARDMVLDSYASFSPELAALARRFFDERWIDAPVRPGKRPGAFCAYTVPSHHPYVFLNWTSKRNDVLTLAHELGHGLHGHLAREQGVFHQTTPLTLAETASVFGETVTFGRLLAATTDPQDRLALLAESIEGGIATVFRQTAMNRFERAMHTARREEGELSVERLGDLWAETQSEMLGDSVEITDNYRSWWSYIPHFVGTPGYVYAYAYGQLLAMSVYHQYETQGSDFVPRYLHLLRAGGSMAPEDLGRIVGCDLADPGFWDGGLALLEAQVDQAEDAAAAAGRL
jgi:oligoendopeptidase F